MKKIILTLLVCIAIPLYPRWFSPEPQKTITIMLDPAGDARETGREIGTHFERSIAHQFTQQLARILKNNNPHIKTVITRAPGELVPHLQNANYANRLQVQLFLSFHFYHTQKAKPDIWLYRYSNGNDFITPTTQLAFYPYDHAYLFNNAITISWAQNMQRSFAQESSFSIHGPYKLPLKPLVGIIAPALCIEIGLKDENDWHSYTHIVGKSIITMLEQHGMI